MFRFLLFFIAVFISAEVYSQQINSADYHIHRNALTNSFQKFQNSKISK